MATTPLAAQHEEDNDSGITFEAKHSGEGAGAFNILASENYCQSRKGVMLVKTPRGGRSTAVPWKAKVLTVFGPGQVTRIATKIGRTVEVTLQNWILANGAKVKIYSPSCVVKAHHRNLSSAKNVYSTVRVQPYLRY